MVASRELHFLVLIVVTKLICANEEDDDEEVNTYAERLERDRRLTQTWIWLTVFSTGLVGLFVLATIVTMCYRRRKTHGSPFTEHFWKREKTVLVESTVGTEDSAKSDMWNRPLQHWQGAHAPLEKTPDYLPNKGLSQLETAGSPEEDESRSPFHLYKTPTARQRPQAQTLQSVTPTPNSLNIRFSASPTPSETARK